MKIKEKIYTKTDGWINQLKRVRRWYKKADLIPSDEFFISDDEMDVYLAFFMNCFHLYDWLKNANVLPKNELDSFFFDGNNYMSICHDICIGTKHSRIDNAKYNYDLKIFREGEAITTDHESRDFIIGNSNVLMIGINRDDGAYISIPKVIMNCMSEMEEFIKIHFGEIQ